MATSGIIDGHDLRWWIADVAIAQALTCSISFSAETRKSTNKDSTGSWSVIKIGERSFTGSCEAHLAEGESYETLWAAFIAGTSLAMQFSTGVTGDQYDECVCFITSLEKTSADNEDVTFSATFEGSGVPTRQAEG